MIRIVSRMCHVLEHQQFMIFYHLSNKTSESYCNIFNVCYVCKNLTNKLWKRQGFKRLLKILDAFVPCDVLFLFHHFLAILKISRFINQALTTLIYFSILYFKQPEVPIRCFTETLFLFLSEMYLMKTVNEE